MSVTRQYKISATEDKAWLTADFFEEKNMYLLKIINGKDLSSDKDVMSADEVIKWKADNLTPIEID